jgi:hypothetical protein
METQQTECEGCNEVKPVPMITIEEGSPAFHGICAECEQNYGMQVGESVRLREPGHEGETEVMFVSPTDNAIVIRYSDGLTQTIPWSAFERPAQG